MKERLLELGGILKWMSSDRQIADGLTKESARTLMASRLRHQRLKLTWDPEYKAMKKKSKAEKVKASSETTTLPGEAPPFKVWHEKTQDGYELESEEVPVNDLGDQLETVNFVSTDRLVSYVFATCHVVQRRTHYQDKRRMQNVFFWLVIFSFLLRSCKAELATGALEAEPATCSMEEPRNDFGNDLFWFAVFAMACMFPLRAAFLLGRCSRQSEKFPLEKVDMVETSTQKDQPIIPERLREELKKEKALGAEHFAAAREARTALVRDGARLLRRLETAVDQRMQNCPHACPTFASRHGDCWHFRSCHVVEQITERNLLSMRGCAYCADQRGPLDFGFPPTLRGDIQAWLADAGF